MIHSKRYITLVALALLSTNPASAQDRRPPMSAGPSKAEIRKTGGAWQLFVNGRPFYIRGAGLESGSVEILAAHGGNSLRTWHTDNGQKILKRARQNGIYVTMGLDLGRERQGFDYNDEAAVARQLAAVKTQVLKYKDQPALIIWAIGNELNLDAHNPKVWNAVNDISKMIHQIDPNHLTTTPLAGLNQDVVREIKARAPDLDLLSVQMYADILNLPRYLRAADWDGPYLVTEWGATGHWEVDKTKWGAPIENDSSTKARFYQKRYEAVMAVDHKQCLGSYAFLWGQKQERTPTWYGVFLATGEETEAVDVLDFLWNGRWPASRSPQITGAWLDGKTARQNVHLKPGETYTAKVSSRSPNNAPLVYTWEILEESKAQSVGGDHEPKPRALNGLLPAAAMDEVVLKAPAKSGAYRLFAYVHDGKGHAGYANIPFYVDASEAASAGQKSITAKVQN